jgi:hypothetical protein
MLLACTTVHNDNKKKSRSSFRMSMCLWRRRDDNVKKCPTSHGGECNLKPPASAHLTPKPVLMLTIEDKFCRTAGCLAGNDGSPVVALGCNPRPDMSALCTLHGQIVPPWADLVMDPVITATMQDRSFMPEVDDIGVPANCGQRWE